MKPSEFIELVLSSPFVDATLYQENLGAEQLNVDAARLYLDLPLRSRPAISFLFDRQFYAATNPDVAGADVDPFIHFVISGCSERRSPHPLIDVGHITSNNPGLLPEPFGTAELYDVLHHDRANPSPYFSLEHYRGQMAVSPPANPGLLEHFVTVGLQAGLRPNAFLDPLWYYRQLDGVHDVWSGLRHFVLIGDSQARAPSTAFSSDRYLLRHPDVAASGTPPLLHYLTVGLAEGRVHVAEEDVTALVSAVPSATARTTSGALAGVASVASETYRLETRANGSDGGGVCDDGSGQEAVAVPRLWGPAPDPPAHFVDRDLAPGQALEPPTEDGATERQALALFRTRAENLLPCAARHPIDFAFTGTPAVSVVMVLGDDFPVTIQALNSLRQSFRGNVELFLIDSSSTGWTRYVSRYIHGAHLLRLGEDLGFVPASNAAISCVTADSVLLLGNEMEPGPEALLLALNRLLSDPRIGAVGAKIISTDGRLLAAGGLIGRDGVAYGYMCGASPLAPEANFVRDVDFCSTAFLLARASLLKQLSGFRDDPTALYFEDADLGARMTQAGYRVVYDPSVVAHRHKHAGPGMDYLRFRHDPDRRAAFARSTASGRRVLFIEDRIPLRTLGSGFVRSNDLLRTMAELGLQVTVFPIQEHCSHVASIYADMPDTVEALYDRSLDGLPKFLDSREGYYDIIWVARTHNLDRIRPILEQHFLSRACLPRVILDTEAIAALRALGRAQLGGETFDLNAALAKEFHNASFCQHVVAVTEGEAGWLRLLGFKNVSVIGHVREPALGPRDFAGRSGLLFIGAIHEYDSPNYDSICWFIDLVLPFIEAELGYETSLTIAGFTADGIDFGRFGDLPRVSFRGQVVGTEPLYHAHRVFVAPTRFAAGAPCKLYEAASFGLPIVSTELLRGQMGWTNERDILSADIADPGGFANHVVNLYRNADLWHRLRNNAAARLADENTKAHYTRALKAIL